jgi:hypothetical protein
MLHASIARRLRRKQVRSTSGSFWPTVVDEALISLRLLFGGEGEIDDVNLDPSLN